MQVKVNINTYILQDLYNSYIEQGGKLPFEDFAEVTAQHILDKYYTPENLDAIYHLRD